MKKKLKKNDHDADDMKAKKKKVIKQGDKKGIPMMKKKGKKGIKPTGKFDGKSNKLGQGGRAAQLRAQGVPGGVIGNLARAAQAAPGQKNFHKRNKKQKMSASTAASMKRGALNC